MFERALEGERRLVTILFCDVKGSTDLAERLDPEDWAEIMNAAFEYLTRPVLRYGGTVARLMGDAVLAFFGAPAAHEDDPQRAVLAGLEIVSGIQPFREQIRSEYGLDFDVRVGINTGVVVVGEMGSALAGEYTAMGDAANLAARMEQTAQPGTVQISADTYRLVSALFEVEPLGGIEVKGKPEPVPAYRALRLKAHPSRQRGIPGLSAPLVGRGPEFESLRQALAGLRQGRGQIVALIGEAGLGKSRLIEELHALAQQDQPTPWFESRGISYDMARPYGLLQQHLRQVCGVQENDPPEVVQAQMEGCFSFIEPEQRSAITHDIQLILATRSAHPPAAGQAPAEAGQPQGEALKRQIFNSLLSLLRALAEQKPLVMVFDDLHWADPASVELLLHAFQLVDDCPIMFLCAFRPHRASPAWGVKTAAETDYPHRYLELNLSPLSNEDSGRLVDGLLSIADLPGGLRQLILRKSEGNPFFLEEVVRELIERDIVQRDESGLRWKAVAGYQEIDIPDSLQALLLARIDRLETDARHTLQLAAVIGRSFYYKVLAAIAATIQTLDKQLSTLERVDLIRQVALQPEREYLFRHELTRDAAYQSILRRQRRQFHLAVGEAIEALFPDHLEEEAHRLAYHFEQANDDERALKYYRTAGEAAARLYANAEAIEHYGKAIQIARRREAPGEQLIYLYTQRGRALELTNQYDEAIRTYQELKALGEARQDQALVLAALLPQATIHSVPSSKFSSDEGRSLSLDALGLARLLGDHRAEAKALWNLMLVEVYLGRNLPEAVMYGEESLAIARQYGPEEQLAYSLHDLARAYWVSGRMEEARAAGVESQQIWRALNNLPMLADSLIATAESLYYVGDFDRSLEFSLEGQRLSQSIQNRWGEAYALISLGLVHLERGEIDQAFTALNRSIFLGEEANFFAPQITNRLALAWVYFGMGDIAAGLEMGRHIPDVISGETSLQTTQSLWEIIKELYSGPPSRAAERMAPLDEALSQGDVFIYFGPIIYAIQVEVVLKNGHFERALELADGYIALMKKYQVHLFLPDLLHRRGLALLGLGRSPDAIQALLDGRAEAQQQLSRRSLWAILVDLIKLLEAGGIEATQGVTVGGLRQEARKVIEYLADHTSEPSLRNAFLNLPEVRGIMG